MRRIALLIAMMFVVVISGGCGVTDQGKPPMLPWETPGGYEARLEMNLETYINSDYRFCISYPNIFSEFEESETGFVAKSSVASLETWTEDAVDKTLSDLYNGAAADDRIKSGSVEGQTFNTTLLFQYRPKDNTDRIGYCYMMKRDDRAYGFKFIYPGEDLATFESYYSMLVKRLLVWNPEDDASIERYIRQLEKYEHSLVGG